MDKKNTVTIRLTDEQFGWLRALSRRSKRSQSEVVRSLIEHGTVRERITRETSIPKLRIISILLFQ